MKSQRTTTRAVLVRTGFDPEPAREPYSLNTAARLAEVHPDRVKHYCRLGLLPGVPDPESREAAFTDQAVFELRRIEFLRREHGVNLSGIRIILNLWRRNESLVETLRFHRGF